MTDKPEPDSVHEVEQTSPPPAGLGQMTGESAKMVVQLLVAGGFVAQAKVDEALAIVKALPACGCHQCAPITMENMRMILCPTCGNKRCPHANDHRNACTNSNEPGQPGSAYPARALGVPEPRAE